MPEEEDDDDQGARSSAQPSKASASWVRPAPEGPSRSSLRPGALRLSDRGSGGPVVWPSGELVLLVVEEEEEEEEEWPLSAAAEDSDSG